MVFVVILLLVLWPLVEIAVFLQVVSWIGVLETLALMVAISLCGAWLVKRQGVGTLARILYFRDRLLPRELAQWQHRLESLQQMVNSIAPDDSRPSVASPPGITLRVSLDQRIVL